MDGIAERLAGSQCLTLEARVASVEASLASMEARIVELSASTSAMPLQLLQGLQGRVAVMQQQIEHGIEKSIEALEHKLVGEVEAMKLKVEQMGSSRHFSIRDAEMRLRQSSDRCQQMSDAREREVSVLVAIVKALIEQVRVAREEDNRLSSLVISLTASLGRDRAALGEVRAQLGLGPVHPPPAHGGVDQGRAPELRNYPY